MMRRGIKKVEMVDAWTQTSNRGSDNEESKKAKKPQPPGLQLKQQHVRVSSNGGALYNSDAMKPRGSMEHIYQHLK